MSNRTFTTSLPLAFSKADQERFSRNAITFQEREVARARRVSFLVGAYAVCVTGIATLLTVALSYTVPSIQLRPVWLIPRADGTTDTFNNPDALPKTMTAAQTRAWLWQYVRLRESYNWADAKDNYDVVSAMSAPDVRRRFQTFYNNQMPNNPSPTKALGKTGDIRVVFRDSDLSDDTFTVRYCRFIELEGQRPNVTPWIVKLHYQTLDQITMLQRIQYNPGALMVTSYPGPEQQGTGGDASADCIPLGGK